MMLTYENIILRKARPAEAQALYDLMVSDEKWTEFNGPYFGYETPTYVAFLESTFQRLLEGKTALAIEFDERLIGTISYYWSDQRTRWLEVGIVIYDSTLWSRGIGRRALIPWVTAMFDSFEIERVGLTTWSGNPRMIKSAQANGFTLEGTIRKVRYYNGVYYDSIKLGVIREEWERFIADKRLPPRPLRLISAE